MKHWFVDTNVLMDFLTNREPFAAEAEQLFLLAHAKQAVLYVASLSFSNAYYLMRQAHSHTDTIGLLTDLRNLTRVVGVADTQVAQALKSNFCDFEDALQYFSAETIPGLSAIITRNPKDFRESKLPILSPTAALAEIQNQ